jgi:Ca-activated chloride channel family protein
MNRKKNPMSKPARSGAGRRDEADHAFRDLPGSSEASGPRDSSCDPTDPAVPRDASRVPADGPPGSTDPAGPAAPGDGRTAGSPPPHGDPPALVPTLIVSPRRAALLAGHDNALDVLVRVQAPAAAEGVTRPPLNLAFVIDRSGSMSGKPLLEAKRCVAHMVQRMGPDDRAAVVVYDDDSRVIVPGRPVDGMAPFLAALAQVHSGGCTDLHGGWAAGAREVSGHVAPGAVSRVVLLSDGNANKGVVDPATIADQCSELLASGVSTSTYGLGVDFNEDLMLRMARAGGGSGYYGESADDLMEPFLQEFALLTALCGRSVTLRFSLPYGASAAVPNDYAPAPDGGFAMPDLAYGGEAWALVRVTIPRLIVDAAGPGGKIDGFEFRVSWADLDGRGHDLPPVAMCLPVLRASAWEAVAEDELVARRAGELEAAELQRLAADAARRRAWDEVDRLLEQARRRAAKNPWIEEVLIVLSALAAQRDDRAFAKEAAYAAHRMSSRLSDSDEGVQFCMAAEAARPAYLRRKSRQGRAAFGDGGK